jgi:hypothetical protein
VTVCVFDKGICRGQGIQPIQDAVPDLRIVPQLNADDGLYRGDFVFEAMR